MQYAYFQDMTTQHFTDLSDNNTVKHAYIYNIQDSSPSFVPDTLNTLFARCELHPEIVQLLGDGDRQDASRQGRRAASADEF